MRKFPLAKTALSIFCSFLLVTAADAQFLAGFQYTGSFHPQENTIHNNVQFNGYTTYWHDDYRQWYRYGNLFKMSAPDPALTIMQSKRDVAEEMQVPGLQMQEGFMNGLISESHKTAEDPSLKDLESDISTNNVLVYTSPKSETGKRLLERFIPDTVWKQQLKSHQYGAADFKEVNAFYLENGNRKLFVIASEDLILRNRLKALIENTEKVLSSYDLHKGWFGAETLLKSVTCGQGHPLEIIGKGLNEGNDWFTFGGYMEFWEKDEMTAWLSKTDLPVVVDFGFSPIYGCKDYDGLQVQDMKGEESWISFAHKKEGYVFRPVYDTASDPYHYDGYIATEGNKEQIDNENIPFISETGSMEDGLVSSMVLFTAKGQQLTREGMWDAIMHRREVAILKEGKMMGPAEYRNALQMLLLDRVYLEEYFGDRIDLQAEIQGYTLNITLSNTYSHAVSGELNIKLPPELKLTGSLPETVTLPANTTKSMAINILPQAEAMEKTNPVTVHFNWEKKTKTTLAILDLPPAISVHRLLYSLAPKIKYPVTIHNFTQAASYPVEVQVYGKNNLAKAVFTTRQNGTAAPGTFQNMQFELNVPPGGYTVKVSALGLTYSGQLGVGKPEGQPLAYKVDLNNDGVSEYRMENDSVLVTLLATGGRVIEYIVKSRKDNIFFKLWPEKADDDKRSFRRGREYYPFGGFEDFLGQPSMETFRVYDAEIVQSKGNYVQVKMSADYFGNKIEKIFTLYGNSPLLEIRYALTFKNPEANVIGPQPILQLGTAHGPEDDFAFPSVDGIQHMRMRMEEYYGHIFTLKEGWNAGYDTKADLSFVGAYPVSQPLFLHVWMNHPRNPDAHYYYTEFQPWTPIFQKSTMYFSYYIWGSGGSWEKGLEELRKRNLITERKTN
ncbi:MAG: hypothetical protein Q8918_00825 [Bacteroidota bacterium]|nr:hypothetical protein [Bacteroidota bacterium]